MAHRFSASSFIARQGTNMHYVRRTTPTRFTQHLAETAAKYGALHSGRKVSLGIYGNCLIYSRDKLQQLLT